MSTNQKVAFSPAVPEGDYIIRGIPVGQGENPGIRKELREFKKDDHLWNLYLLGLWEFQRLSQDHQLSYFQIAGIHGLPHQPWPVNDEILKKLKKGNGKTGFCTHTSILFLSWHRPYLALFESILQQAMLHVANQFDPEEGRDQYVTAAKHFRMPYWDWARPGLDRFPDTGLARFPDEAIDSDAVTVVMPRLMREANPDLERAQENLIVIPNPLYAYRFEEDTAAEIKVNARATTTRYDREGSEELSPKAKKELLLERITPINREVNQLLPVEGNLSERVMYLLQAYKSFSYVSHNKWDPMRVPNNINPNDEDARPLVRGLGFGSFEDIHNALHNLVGGTEPYTGHMAHVPKSAFDPIFWLHHTNIDRLAAIWQGLHDNPSDPDTWVTPQASGGPPSSGTWITEPGEVEGPETPLAPFYKKAGTFWESRDVKETTTFGYAYPETQSWLFKSQDEYRQDVKKQLLRLYPWGSLGNMIAASIAGDKEPEAELRKRAKELARIVATKKPTALTALSLAQAASKDADSQPFLTGILPQVQIPAIKVPDGRSLPALAKNSKYLEWLVNIKAEKHSLGGEYLVHVFLGPVSLDEPTYRYALSPYHVGTFSPLGQSSSTGCGKCQRDQAAHAEITGQIPLTIALVERYFAGLLDGFSENEVVEYLKLNLHWVVVDANGTRREKERYLVDGLLVGVSSNEVTLPQNQYDLPHYSPDIVLYPEITTKKDGKNGRAEKTGITASNIFTAPS